MYGVPYMPLSVSTIVYVWCPLCAIVIVPQSYVRCPLCAIVRLLCHPAVIVLYCLMYGVLGVPTLSAAARTGELLPLDDPELLTVVKPRRGQE